MTKNDSDFCEDQKGARNFAKCIHVVELLNQSDQPFICGLQ